MTLYHEEFNRDAFGDVGRNDMEKMSNPNNNGCHYIGKALREYEEQILTGNSRM